MLSDYIVNQEGLINQSKHSDDIKKKEDSKSCPVTVKGNM